MEYSNFRPSDDCPLDVASVRASLEKINELMSTGTQSSWLWRPNEVKSGKIAHYRDIIKKNGSIPRSAFRVDSSGELSIMSGRHRCYALLEAGYKIIEICTLPEMEDRLSKLVGIAAGP